MAERRQNSRRAKDAKHSGPNRRSPKERRNSERRADTRVALELWMEELVGDDVYFRRTGNLSAGGVFFDSAIPHQLGTEMTLKFTLPGCKEMVVARGKVVSQLEKRPMAWEWALSSSVSKATKKIIETFIKAL